MTPPTKPPTPPLTAASGGAPLNERAGVMTDQELTELVRARLVKAVSVEASSVSIQSFAAAYAALKGLDRPAPAQPVAVPQELADAVWHVVDMWEDSLPSPSGKDWRPDWLNNLAEITEKYIPREASDER